MKKLFLTILGCLLHAASLPAQESSGNVQRGTGINLSLWKGVATQRTDTTGNTCFNLGFCSAMNRLNGVGINAIASIVRTDTRGLQVTAITNVNGNNVSGISLAGLVGITGNRANGVIFSGLANIIGQQSNGVSIGGVLNIAGGTAEGVQLAGLGNITGTDMHGFTAAGLLNIVGKEMSGVQLAGIATIAGEEMQGVQLSPFNVALRGRGLQIGLVNYYQEEFNGLQLGLVNVNPQTHIQLMLFGGNATKLNAGVRFKNKHLYTILGGGTHYLDFSDKFSASFSYRAGVAWALCKRLSLSGDLGYQHIETFRNKSEVTPARLYALQARMNLECRMTDRMGLFLTGGYGGSRYYNRNRTYDKGIIVEGGVIIETVLK